MARRRSWALVSCFAALLACRAALGIGDLPGDDAGESDAAPPADGSSTGEDGAPSEASVIAQNQQQPVAIALDTSDVYWINATGSVLHCPKTGCAGSPSLITTFTSIDQADSSLFALAVDSSSVYFVARTSFQPLAQPLMECGIAGCGNTPTVLLPNVLRPSLAFANGSVFVPFDFQGDSGVPAQGIAECSVGGCAQSPTLFASDPAPLGVLAHDGVLYWASDDTQALSAVKSCPLTGCNGPPSTVLHGMYAVSGGAANDSSLFISFFGTSGVGLLTCPIDAGCGSSPLELVSGLSGGTGSLAIGLTATKVYFQAKGDQSPWWLLSCGLTGCSNTPANVLPAPVDAFAVDDSNVYWVDTDAGKVLRAPL